MASLVCRWLEMARDGDAPATMAAAVPPGAAARNGTPGGAVGEAGGSGPAGAAGGHAAQQLDEAYYLRQLAKASHCGMLLAPMLLQLPEHASAFPTALPPACRKTAVLPCHLPCHLLNNLFAPCLPSPLQERFDPQLFATVFTSGGSGAPQWLNGLIAEPGGFMSLSVVHPCLASAAVPVVPSFRHTLEFCLPEPAPCGWCGAPTCLFQAMLRMAHLPTLRPPCPHRGPPAGVRAGGAVQELAAAQLCHPQNPDAAGAREGGEGLGVVWGLGAAVACAGQPVGVFDPSWVSCPAHQCPLQVAPAGGSRS